MKTAIVIPARYGSTRFPGKPLAKINGRTMLSLVVDVAKQAAANFKNSEVFVTTEDARIADHANQIAANCILTSEDCPTGSDRVLEALKIHGKPFDVAINLQGDAPFTPAATVAKIISAFEKNIDLEVVTPVHQLSWSELDQLRKAKETTPFSGTTAVLGSDSRAIWFSKSILPAIRIEDRSQNLSPVFQHIGLYGYRFDILEKFCALPQSRYEQLEGLEQLRLLENGISIHTVQVAESVHSGIDSPEDLERLVARV